jgi:Replication initiator protein, pSAM2
VAPVHHLPAAPARPPGRDHPAPPAQFIKVAEYQHRGSIHYHTVIRLDAPGDSHQPPPPRYTTQLLEQAIRATVAAVRYDTAAVTGDDPLLRRVLRFGTQTDTRPIQHTSAVSGTGRALSAQAVSNYIAKHATKTSAGHNA